MRPKIGSLPSARDLALGGRCDGESSSRGTLASARLEPGFVRQRFFAAPGRARQRVVRLRARGVAAWALASGVACTPATEPVRSRPPLVVTEGRVAADVGARWYLHPSGMATMRARLRLGGERSLYVGDSGERWLVQEGGDPEGAAFAAPEPLVGVGRTEEQYAFLGRSGHVYLADTPLGSFVTIRPAPESFVSVSLQGTTIAAAARDGSLWSGFDWGKSWRRASAPSAHVVSVGLARGGAGLALAVPERWLVTTDGGSTWENSTLAPRGAKRLLVDGRGSVVVDGILGAERFENDAFVPLPRLPETTWDIEMNAGASPDAAALEAGNAVLEGLDYLELARRGKTGERGWVRVSGRLGERLETEEVSELSDCLTVRLARRGDFVALVCAASQGEQRSTPLSLWISQDAGKTFERRLAKLRGIIGLVQIAVGPRGEILLGGLCPPHLTAKGCAPRGTYQLAPKEPELASVPTPGLGQPRALALGVDGSAYVLGRRDKDFRLTLYHGAPGQIALEPTDLSDALGEGLRVFDAEEVPEDRALRLGIGQAGTVSIERHTRRGIHLATTDAVGRVLTSSEPPPEADSVSAHGRKVLAIDVASRSVWESVDGGASFRLLPLPRKLCDESTRTSDCNVPLVCGSDACVIGDVLSRIGWEGASEGALPTFEVPATEGHRPGSRKTPIACTLVGEDWQLLRGVSTAPRAGDASIGKTRWFALGSDPETAAAWVLHVEGAAPEARERELLAPVTEPTRYAFDVLEQIEGSVAIRYRVPQVSRGERQITHVEVAWDNRFEDDIGRASVPGQFDFVPGDFESRAAKTHRALPALVSVAGKGAYVRLHHEEADRQPTYYVKAGAVREIPEVPWPKMLGNRGRSEMVRVGPADAPLRILDDGPFLVRAERNADWAFRAFTLGAPEPTRVGIVQAFNIAYTGTHPGFGVVQATPDGAWARAYVLPLDGDGQVFSSPIAVPLQPNLADPPVPCEAAVRGSTPRFVAPLFPAAPHPVLVSHSVEPPVALLTARAVLHGTVDSPCAAALEALAPQKNPGESLRAIIPVDDLPHSWVFREEQSSRWERHVYARPMSCRFDPTLVIPEALLPSEPGGS